MKKVSDLLCGFAFLFVGSQVYAQVLPDKMIAVSSSSDIELTVKDDLNRTTNEKPMVMLPDGSLVFTASADRTGEELYICKDDQITLIKDVRLGRLSSNPQWLTVVDDKVYFTATTTEFGEELWITDGTESGTKMVKDIYPGSEGSEIFGLTAFNGKCLFFARDYESELDPVIDSQIPEEWLWISDGTEDGTQRIGDVVTRKGIDGTAGFIIPAGDKAFFIGYDRTFNETLWVTDGTATGTYPIKDIYPVPASGGDFSTEAAVIDWLTDVTNDINDIKVIFRANTLDNSGKKIGSEIWISDGTESGTKWIGVDYHPGENNGVPNNSEFAFPVYHNGKVYFRAKDGIHGCEPGVTDFTAAGTHYICDINFWNNQPWQDSWGPELPFIYEDYLFCTANGSYYYPANTYRDSGYSLWRYNLAEEGVTPDATNGLTGFEYQSNWTNGKEIYPGNNSDVPRWFTICGGRLYFRAEDSGNNHELWVMEGKDDTPKKVVDFAGNGRPHNLIAVDNSLYFIATSTNTLYKYNPEPRVTGNKDIKREEVNFKVMRAGNTFLIDCENELETIQVIDLTGNYLISQPGSQTSINVSNLNSGIYIIHAKDIHGAVMSKKVVK